MICPFYKNKEVFNGFNEIVEALGGRPLTEDEFKSAELRNQRSGLDFAAMEAAYTLYHRNNGNFLDLAPNGERSVLFDTYLQLFNDDRIKAIQKKAEVYSDKFINWFGDWLSGSTNTSEVDQNGEPLLEYVSSFNDRSVTGFSQLMTTYDNIENSRQQFIQQNIQMFKQTHQDDMSDDQLNIRSADIARQSRKQFNENRITDLLQKQQQDLVRIFGASYSEGIYTFASQSSENLLKERIINSLNENTWNSYVNIKHGDINLKLNEKLSPVNVIYQSMYDGDLTTFNKQIIRDYISLFFNSELIQAGLKAISKEDITLEERISLLADAISQRTLDIVSNKRLQAYIDSFWDDLNNISSTIISENDVTEQQKEQILKNITDAILIKEDMFYSEMDQPLYDAFTGNFDSSTFLSKEDKDIFQSIRSGTITRLKSVQSRYLKNTTLIEKLKARVEILETTDEDSAQQIFDTIEDFLITANDELQKTMGYINIDLKSKPIYEWSPLEINFINQDLIGYYEPLIRDISMLFADKSSAIYTINKQRIEREGGLSLANTANQLRSYVDELKSTYQKDVVMKWSKWYINDQIDKDESITNKALFKENAHRWLEQDMTTGDLATGEVLIGMASRSKSSIIKIADWVSFQAEQEIHRKTLNKGIELVNLYNKIRPFGSQISPLNFFNKFVEKDKKGMPTGYFIRKHNYGQYYQDKDEFEQSLREKYNLGVDENGNTIFPENEDSKADNSTYNQYMDELDEWTDSRIHRRYKLSYYKKRRRILSAKSILASDQIQRQIDILEQKASVDGWFDSTKLTKNEINQLKKYRQEKEDLSNFYTYITTSNGRIIIEEKTGDALQIARELSEWKNIRSKYIKYTPNWDKFNQAKQELINRYGADSKEVIDFEKNNTSKRISQDFWDKFFIHNDPNYSKLEIEYRKRYRDLLQMSKDKYGYYLPHLIKFGEGLNGEDVSVWRELKRVELKIQELRDQRIALQGNSGVVKTDLDLYDFVTDAFVNVPGTSKSFYTHLKEKWQRAIDEDPTMAQKFDELFTYQDSKGRTKILKAFKYIRPKKETFNIAGEQVDTIEIVPSIYFSEVDKTSTWVNEDYDLNSSDELQFKNEEYINKDFDSITGDLKTFYDKMLDIMDEANSLIPKKALSRRYLLPQISGRKMQVFGRQLKHIELFQGMKYCMQDLFGFTYAESTAEASTNTDLPRRPDGSIVNNIPVRFQNKLENPSVISTDLISSIILYYEMAVNYSEKSKVLPSLELINQAIRPKSEYVGLPQQSKKLENMLDIRFYGHESTYGSAGKKLSKTNQRTIQSAKTLKKWAAVGMLGMNFTAAEVGHLDAMFVAIGDAFGQKYITKRDLLVGYGQMWAHVPKMLSGLGKQSVNDKMVALMQLNNLSKSNSEIFEFSDMSRASKFLKQHLLMGGFTLGDYMINTMLIGAVYNNYRLLIDPTTGKERFMSLEEFIISSENIGLTEKEAKRIYYKSKTHLFDAYIVENGLAKVKPEYVHAVTKKVQNTVAGLLQDRSAVYNGLLPDTEKAKLQQNVFGSYVTLMRRFMINQYWEKFNTQVDYVAKDDSEVSWTSAYTRDDIYGHNFRTGVEQGAVFKDFIRGMCKYGKNLLFFYRHTEAEKLTRNQRYAVKRTLAEWACLALICYAMINSILFARKKDYDDDKKPVWTINLIDPVGQDRNFLEFDFDNWDEKFFNHLRWKSALLTTRLFTERAGTFWPGTIMELLTSPTTVYSYITDVGRTLDLCADFLGINGHSNDEMIKTGAYKNMSRGTRDVLKMFKANGVDNLVRNWHTDGVKSVLNYYSKITPTEWFIPAKESKSSKESTNTVSTNTHYNVD